jgi:hypothetical protein
VLPGTTAYPARRNGGPTRASPPRTQTIHAFGGGIAPLVGGSSAICTLCHSGSHGQPSGSLSADGLLTDRNKSWPVVCYRRSGGAQPASPVAAATKPEGKIGWIDLNAKLRNDPDGW